jgi:hypothetical protein
MADPQMLTAEGEEVLREEINKRIGGVWLPYLSFSPLQARALSLRCCSMLRSTVAGWTGKM